MGVGNIFPAATPSIDDDGFMSVNPSSNMAENSEITGTVSSGSFSEMWDYDPATFCSFKQNGTGTSYFTFDMFRKYRNILITIFYNFCKNNTTDPSVCTLQISDDGTTWTDIDTITGVQDGCTSAHISEKHDFRYLRWKIVSTDAAGTVSIFNLKLSKVGQ